MAGFGGEGYVPRGRRRGERAPARRHCRGPLALRNARADCGMRRVFMFRPGPPGRAGGAGAKGRPPSRGRRAGPRAPAPCPRRSRRPSLGGRCSPGGRALRRTGAGRCGDVRRPMPSPGPWSWGPFCAALRPWRPWPSPPVPRARAARPGSPSPAPPPKTGGGWRPRSSCPGRAGGWRACARLYAAWPRRPPRACGAVSIGPQRFAAFVKGGDCCDVP